MQSIEGLLHEFSPQFFFIGGSEFGVARYVHDAGSEDDPIGANHFGDRQGRGDLHDRDARFLEFGCDRSAAASARASRRSENDGVDTIGLDLGGYFSSQAAGIRERV